MTPSPSSLESLWRDDPEMIGPVAPPMVLWLLRGSPKDQWQIDAERRRAEKREYEGLPLFAELGSINAHS